MTFGVHALSIQLREFFGHVFDSFAYPGFGFLPFRTPQPVQADRRIFAGTDIFRNQVKLGNRNIQHIVFGIADLDIIFDDALQIELLNAIKNANPVGGVYHIFPRG